MRVLMLAPQPFFEPRGTPISVYQRLEALSALGHHVDLITFHVGADIHIPNVRVYRTPRIPFIQEVRIGPSWAKLPLDAFLFLAAFLRMLTRRYHVIHSHEEAAFFAIFLGALFRIPHVYDMHSSLPRQLENFNFGNWRPLVRLFEWLERLTLTSCQAVITIDSELEHYVQRMNPCIPHMMIENRAIPAKLTLVDSDLSDQLKRNGHLNSRQLIVYTGTFERYQGLDMLLQSAKIVSARNRRALFVLVGGKPRQIEQYQALVAREGLLDCVVFVGIVPPDEALAFLELADVLVSPRISGSFAPLKIYSYLSSGKPTVATRIAAHADVLSAEVALLVEPTAQALAEGILFLLENEAEREKLGRRARQYALKQYNGQEYTAKLEQLYRLLHQIESGAAAQSAVLEKSEI